MGKAATPRALADTEAKAVSRMLRISPQKLNLLAQLIRGKKVSRALADLDRVRAKLAPNATLPAEAPSESLRLVAWADRRLVRTVDGSLSLLPDDMPDDWYGLGFEAHRVPTVGADSLSFAVRWHGFRPAVLWDQHGASRRLTSPFAPEWSSTDSRGETLWPEQG